MRTASKKMGQKFTRYEEMKGDRSIVLAAVQQDGRALEHVAVSLFSRKSIKEKWKNHKKTKSILRFYPPFSPLLANLSSNSSPSRRALQFGSVKSGFGCTDVEKNDDLVSVTTCFKIFEGISMFFDAFTLCWACFELSGCF